MAGANTVKDRPLLAAEETPPSYSAAYRTIITADSTRHSHDGGRIYAEEAREILASTGLTSAVQEDIFQLVHSAQGGQEKSQSQSQSQSQGLAEAEFYLLLALIGLVQEGKQAKWEVVDERRNSLPTPKIGYINDLRPFDDIYAPRPDTTPADGGAHDDKEDKDDDHDHDDDDDDDISTKQSTPNQRTRQNTSYTYPDIDPWGEDSATVPRTAVDMSGAPHLQSSMTAPVFSTGLDASFNEDIRKSSLGSTPGGAGAAAAATAAAGIGGGLGGFQPPPLSTRPTFGSSAWADTFPSNPGFLDPTSDAFGPGGFEGVRVDRTQTGANNLSRTLGGSSKIPPPPRDDDEIVSIIMLPEKEGMFMFQHRNYEVKSSKKGTSVIRRYSDFVWLHDCLIKKYPFRQVPLLPPKRVAVNGTHLAADSTSFLDKRRRGLIRFTNALVQHPVLSQEQLVVMFLTVPTELSVWRKQATVSIQEEFTGKMMPPELEDSLPPTLAETFEIVRSGIKRSAEIYINLCNSFDRYARRCEGLGAEQYRIARLMQNLTDCMHDTYAADNKDVPTLNLGISATARHLMASQGLLEDETAAWNEGVLEDLKKQRDCLVAMRDLFDRRDRYARDNIAQLEGRIASNQKKLRELKGKPEGTVKPTELERIENNIIADKTSIVQQHERGVLIKECVRDEVLYFQVSQYRISRLHQDWSQERVKYAELQASNWRSMAEDVETMPSRW